MIPEEKLIMHIVFALTDFGLVALNVYCAYKLATYRLIQFLNWSAAVFCFGVTVFQCYHIYLDIITLNRNPNL